MKKRLFLITIILTLLVITFFSATEVGNTIPIQIQALDASGNIAVGTYTFQINISNSITCSPVLYSNTTTKTTDSRGIVTYNLENVDLAFDEQYWFCYYRDGTLKQTIKAARVPYTFQAKNTTLSGVKPDVNFDLTSYNITTTGTGFFSYLGSLLSRITNLFVGSVDATGNISTTGNVTAEYFFGNGSQLTGVLTAYSEADPYWTGNQSSYFNTTDILGFGYYNLTGFDISNYYLLSNPFGFYNSTNPPPSSGITWAEVVNGTVYLSSNPFGFYNSTTLPAGTEPLWNANYSDFLTHITWANAVNGTLRLTSNLSFDGGNSSFDTSALFIDSVSDKVGIGTTSPLSILHIDADSAASSVGVIIESNSSKSGSVSPRLGLVDAFSTNPGSSAPAWFIDNYATDFRIFQKPNITTSSESIALFIESTNNNVGIGTVSPAALLHVKNGSAGQSVGSDTKMAVEGSGKTEIEILGNDIIGLRYSFNSAGGMGRIYINETYAKMYFVNNYNDVMTFDSSGNVGIGTTSPTHKLNVVGDAVINANFLSIRHDGSDTIGQGAFLELKDEGTGDFDLIHLSNSGHMDFYLYDAGTGIGTTAMRIQNDGNVGIGTVSPAVNLDVNGQIAGKSSFSTYTGGGLFAAAARPSYISTPAGKKLLFGYSDAGSGQYVPRIGFYTWAEGAPGNQAAASCSIGLTPITGHFTITYGSADDLALQIANSNGNAWFVGDVSALSFTDRTPYPKNLSVAYEALNSVKGIASINGTTIDKSKLNPILKSGEGGRDLSMTVSVLTEVVKDLTKQNADMKKALCSHFPEDEMCRK